MAPSLPPKPSLEQLRKQAKDLLKSHRAGDPSCYPVLRRLNRFADATDAGILQADLALKEAQFALAMDYGFASWDAIKKHVQGQTDRRYLHLLCGDNSGGILRNSTVPGEVAVWMEDFINGPVCRDLPEDQWRRLRSQQITTYFRNGSLSDAIEGTNRRYEKLAQAVEYGEVVLWFDACLFDQTIMIHLIDRLAALDLGGTKLSLICVGEFPGFDLFKGFGELTSEQMAPLFETRHEVTAAEVALARAAWRAYASGDPREIEALISGDCSALPYLAAAMRRRLEDFPSVRNGLSRTQRQLLTAIADGAHTLGELCTIVSKMEGRPFWGDMGIWTIADELATAATPLLAATGPESLASIALVDHPRPSERELRRWRLDLTGAGRSVLDGQADAIELNGIDRWMGGVHLTGSQGEWRWDETQSQLVGSPVDDHRQPPRASRGDPMPVQISNVTIRPMTREDLPALRRYDDEATAKIAELNALHPPDGFETVPGGPWSDDAWLSEHVAKFERQGGMTLLAEDGGRIVGFADLWPTEEPAPFGQSLCVQCIDQLKDYYLAGLETVLLAEAEKVARKMGLPALDVGTNTCSGEYIALRRFGLEVFYEYENLQCRCGGNPNDGGTLRKLTPGSADLSGLIKVNHWSPTDFTHRGDGETTHLVQLNSSGTRAVVEFWRYEPGRDDCAISPQSPPNRTELYAQPDVLSSAERMGELLTQCAAIAGSLGSDEIELPCPSGLSTLLGSVHIVSRRFAFAWLRKRLS